jgi:hypothetical protein
VIENAVFEIVVSVIEESVSVPTIVLDIIFDYLAMAEVFFTFFLLKLGVI